MGEAVAFTNLKSTQTRIERERFMKKRVQQKRRPRAMLWFGVVAITLAATFFLFGKNEDKESFEPTPFASTPGDISGTAPAFTLPDLNGSPVSLSDFKGKVVVLNFWATWCPPCKREIPDFIELQSDYGSKGLQIVGVALDRPESVKEFAAANGMNYQILLGNNDVAARYGGVKGIPTTFVIDRTGKIAAKFVGFRTKEIFESEIKKLL